MTKKHYQAIADIVSTHLYSMDEEIEVEGRLATVELTYKLAKYFKQDNPRFDRERFLGACGITERVER